MAVATCDALGAERIAWLSTLPMIHTHDEMALVHASPGSTWRSPGHEASDADLESTYKPLGKAIAIYGHIHRSYIRRVGEMTIVNTGSVSLSYDGDRQAAYLLLDDMKASIRRVEYDVAKEVNALAGCGLPHSDWVARILESGAPVMP